MQRTTRGRTRVIKIENIEAADRSLWRAIAWLANSNSKIEYIGPYPTDAEEYFDVEIMGNGTYSIVPIDATKSLGVRS